MKGNIPAAKVMGERNSSDRQTKVFTIISGNIENCSSDRPNSKYLVLSIELGELVDRGLGSIDRETIKLIPTIVKSTAVANDKILALAQRDYQLYVETFNSLTPLSLGAINQRQTKAVGLSPFKLEKILDFIGDRLSQKINISQMAKYLDMSPFYFVREFKKAVGVSPYQYIMQQRVEMAKQILRQQRELPIVEIALECGFSNQSHLSKVFKQHTGKTPKRYRDG